jgi:hypothetical protein
MKKQKYINYFLECLENALREERKRLLNKLKSGSSNDLSLDVSANICSDLQTRISLLKWVLEK